MNWTPVANAAKVYLALVAVMTCVGFIVSLMFVYPFAVSPTAKFHPALLVAFTSGVVGVVLGTFFSVLVGLSQLASTKAGTWGTPGTGGRGD